MHSPIRAGLNTRHGLSVGLGTVWRFLKAQNLTLKKSLHAAEQQRADVAEARRAFIRRQPALDPERLVFLDETWASTNMTRRRGRCARGLRLPAPVSHGHWKTTTLIAGLRTTGITAPYVFDGAVNGVIFRAYVEQVLAPTLDAGDLLILDNLPSHKLAGVREAIAASGPSICRPTAPTSIPSSKPSPSSRLCSARLPSEPATASGPPSGAPSN